MHAWALEPTLTWVPNTDCDRRIMDKNTAVAPLAYVRLPAIAPACVHAHRPDDRGKLIDSNGRPASFSVPLFINIATETCLPPASYGSRARASSRPPSALSSTLSAGMHGGGLRAVAELLPDSTAAPASC